MRSLVICAVGCLCMVLGAMVISGCTPAPRFRAHGHPVEAGERATHAATDTTRYPEIRLVAPVSDLTAKRITSGYGTGRSGKHRGSNVHQGVDIKARPAETVRAAATGTVAFSGKQRGFGNVVILDHGGGVTTLYAHLFYACVRRGDRVEAGDTIGRAGKRGAATTTHLHFEIRSRGTPLDPMPYLRPCLRSP